MGNLRRSECLGGFSSNLTTGADALKPPVYPFSIRRDEMAKLSVFTRVLRCLTLNIMNEFDILTDLWYNWIVRW